jgi:hypothetical protein
MEYQYFEFRALERPLTKEEQQRIKNISKRVQLTSTQAVFPYNYGDISHPPEKLVEKYFDAMLYVTNFAVYQLIFRLPRSLVDLDALQPYIDAAEDLTTIVNKTHVVIKINIYDEGGGSGNFFIKGEGQIDELLPLRDDLMRGDLRLLYIAWLRAGYNDLRFWDNVGYNEEYEDDLEDDEDGEGKIMSAQDYYNVFPLLEGHEDTFVEPPVPPGLRQLTAPYHKFIELFDIDEALVDVAADASPDITESATPLEAYISLLSKEEQHSFLVRLANGEPLLHQVFQNRLQEVAPPSSRTAPATEQPRRPLRMLIAESKDRAKQLKEQKRKAADTAHQQYLTELATNEEERGWQRVLELIEHRKMPSYKKAVNLLVDLHEVAEKQGTVPQFEQRLDDIVKTYKTRWPLIKGLEEVNLR